MVKKLKTAPSARVAQKREQARQEILSSAQSILREQGPEAVTLAAVAGRLGMTKQSLYHYFASKEALDRGLVTTLLDEEIEALLSAITALRSNKRVLGVLIQTFYAHYSDNLEAFRSIYSQSQLFSSSTTQIDEVMLREDIHPLTRHLFDVLEEKVAGVNATRSERRRARQLAFTAWTSALGMMTMLSIADATNDPVAHSEQALLKVLSRVFDAAS
jgi:AcrR family transcriptional regulator